jgi:Fe-S cluster assembly iron-binding protein IscA
VLELTPSTIEIVRNISGVAGMRGVRITVDPRVGGRLVLSASFADAPEDGDQVIESDGAVVYLDAAATRVLDAKRLDGRVAEGRLHFAILDQ